jgi:hypothetical protein
VKKKKRSRRQRAASMRNLRKARTRLKKVQRRRVTWDRERYRTELHMPELSVEKIATDRSFQNVVRRFAWVGSLGGWNLKNTYRGSRRTPLSPPARATIEISSYLTKEVPERMRRSVITMRREGDAVVQAARMYLRVYRANQKLGGSRAVVTASDLRRRVASRRRASKRDKRPRVLLNRGFEHYVWGHDLSDLVFESMRVRWTGPRKCHVTFGIGS